MRNMSANCAVKFARVGKLNGLKNPAKFAEARTLSRAPCTMAESSMGSSPCALNELRASCRFAARIFPSRISPVRVRAVYAIVGMGYAVAFMAGASERPSTRTTRITSSNVVSPFSTRRNAESFMLFIPDSAAARRNS